MYLRQTILNSLLATLKTATGSLYTSNIGNVIKIYDGSQFDNKSALDAYIFPAESAYESDYEFTNAITPVSVETNYEVVIYSSNGSGSLQTAMTAIDDVYTVIGNNFNSLVNGIPTLELKMASDFTQIHEYEHRFVLSNVQLKTRYKIPNFHPSGSL